MEASINPRPGDERVSVRTAPMDQNEGKVVVRKLVGNMLNRGDVRSAVSSLVSKCRSPKLQDSNLVHSVHPERSLLLAASG